MAYEPHLRINFGGRLGEDATSPETWQCGLHFTRVADTVAHDLEDLAEATYGHLASFINTTYFTSAVNLEWCKASRIDTTGHVVGAVGLYEGTPVNGNSGTTIPFQIAAVVSLRTGERGPAKRGRFYLPCVDLALDNGDGLWSSTSAFQTYVGAVLEAIETDPEMIDSQLCVASGVAGNTLVTNIAVGRVPDTVRRRRRSLDDYVNGVAYTP